MDKEKIIECVPNFSEGRNTEVIEKIAQSIRIVPRVELRNIDIGYAANRTVITFTGPPEDVVQAAYNAVKTASELIDMSLHKGEHPRIGATDVLPLIPLKGVSMEQCIEYARALAHRISSTLGIPTYLYQEAATTPLRKNLALCRSGEWENIRTKLENPMWKPDFGSNEYTPIVHKSGITVVGAREFLIAVNFNLNTNSRAVASSIASAIREKGSVVKDDNGVIMTDSLGEKIFSPGLLKGVKAIGWYIEEYGVAQVSVNIVDRKQSPLHIVYQAVCQEAQRMNYSVTGTEIIGMIPSEELINAGKYFSTQKHLGDEQYISIAIEKMNLNDIKPFDKESKILYY